MYYILNEATEAVKSAWDVWAPVAVQTLITVGVIFGGAGFWQYKQAKFQAKQEEKSKHSGVESKVDTLTDNVTKLSEKVDDLSDDVKELKKDLELLQKANDETVNYRKIRDTADKEAMQIQKAVIESLKSMMRERLLEVYKKCIKKGYYTKEERDVYKPLFDCYVNDPFHGNGVMHDLQPIMVNLPWTAEDAGIRNDEDSYD